MPLPSLGKDVLKRKRACPMWAKAKLENKSLAHIRQRQTEKTNSLPTAGKAFEKRKCVCQRRARENECSLAFAHRLLQQSKCRSVQNRRVYYLLVRIIVVPLQAKRRTTQNLHEHEKHHRRTSRHHRHHAIFLQ